jgi:hypothetical protein
VKITENVYEMLNEYEMMYGLDGGWQETEKFTIGFVK